MELLSNCDRFAFALGKAMSRFYAFLEKRGFEEQSDFFFFF